LRTGESIGLHAGDRRDYDGSAATMMTRACSASFTAGSSGAHQAILDDSRHGHGALVETGQVGLHRRGYRVGRQLGRGYTRLRGDLLVARSPFRATLVFFRGRHWIQLLIGGNPENGHIAQLAEDVGNFIGC
jgi:hypothetical protein